MEFLRDIFASGRIADLIIGLMVIEAVGLVTYYKSSGRGIPPGPLLTNMAAGLCLLLALRGALAGAGWVWVALCLAASLVAHVADLASRWRN